ncbi:hypothetical protein ACB098_01G102000 [Castanea mollissima]
MKREMHMYFWARLWVGQIFELGLNRIHFVMDFGSFLIVTCPLPNPVFKQMNDTWHLQNLMVKLLSRNIICFYFTPHSSAILRKGPTRPSEIMPEISPDLRIHKKHEQRLKRSHNISKNKEKIILILKIKKQKRE